MSFLKLKNYTGKIPLRLLFSRLFLHEISVERYLFCSASSVRLKIFFYALVKILTSYKLKNFLYDSSCYNDYGRKLQDNGLYNSLVEAEKKEKLQILNNKIYRKKSFFCVKNSFQKVLFLDLGIKKKRTLKNLSKGLERFEKYFINPSRTAADRQVILTLLKAKTFINRIFVSRLFLSIGKGRKKYRSSFSYVFRRKRKLESLLNIFALTLLKFKEIKVQRRRNFKKLAWKMKKQKKWSRLGSWNLFRLRQRLSQVFYVPKHFEINYKTLSVGYLGFTDFKTINTRIPFWLNLRRLLTFLS